MSNIIKAKDLPEEENVYVKKGFAGEWRVVYPWRKEDGKLNWFAVFFGSKGNMIQLIIYSLLAAGLYLGILDLIDSYKQVASNPCNYCADQIIAGTNFSNLNLSLKGG